MRFRSLLVIPLALTALVTTATPAFPLRGGVESTQRHSFMGSLQRPESPRADGHVCVVGVHSTGNDNGENCTENNPCETDAAGNVIVRQGAHYGQQVAGVAACLAPGSVLDLSRPGCTLPRTVT